MKAMVLNEYGDGSKFKPVELAKPSAKAGHVVVRIAATSVNTVDTMIRNMGKDLPLSPDLPAVLGMDFAGTIEAAGRSVELEVTQKSPDFPVARRPERRKTPEEKAPRGKPKAPGVNPELEPIRQAMLGNASVIVTVNRRDEILDCVAAFREHGIEFALPKSEVRFVSEGGEAPEAVEPAPG